MPNFNTPLEAFFYWEQNDADRIFLRQPVNGTYTEHTYGEAGLEARKIASAIIALDLPPRSQIALLSKNCSHWFMADLAIMMAGHVSVPIYPTLNADSIAQILQLSHAKAIFIGKLDDFESQEAGISGITKIGVAAYGHTTALLWEGLLEQHPPLTTPHQQKPEELTTLIYTSGTTGKPKGVMHSAGNFMTSAAALVDLVALPEHPKLFSYLPLSHIAERAGVEMRGMFMGAQIFFAESLDTFARDLEAAQPHSFGAVPRIMTKFQGKILEQLPQKKLNVLLKIPLLKNLIKNKLRKKLGLRDARIIVSGAAPMAKSLLHWYAKLGIAVNQMYGMTEDCIVSHTNVPGANKIGSVGKPLKGVLTKLSPEGEICIKNDCLLLGYFEAPEATKATFTSDGFLKTGDVGEYDHDGYLTITGRLKDQFKTDKGKYIAPAPIELALSKNTDIDQICIVGTGIPQPIALITPSLAGKEKPRLELSSSLETTRSELNQTLEKHEKIEKVVVMKEEWTVDNGCITPTLKLKRNTIEQMHRAYYKLWFELPETVLFE